MDAYVSEQEQVEQIRRWWKNNGNALLLGLALGIGGLAAYRYWDATQAAHSESASQNYEQLIEMAAAQKIDDAMKAGHAIIEAYPDSVYAKLSGLLVAKMAVEKNDYPQAKAELQRMLDSDGHGELANLARERLARLLLAEGKADDAFKLLQNIPPVAGEDGIAELRADVLAARGDIKGARSKYLEALASADKLGLDRESIQLKLDNLSSPAAAKTNGS
ncbi:MAG: tetratricopeptide repeat protein [Gammaproteobacteria bacterium]|nr:tetratricopeptide repeat protein [Gammaproteobacteria bacterium]